MSRAQKMLERLERFDEVVNQANMVKMDKAVQGAVKHGKEAYKAGKELVKPHLKNAYGSAEKVVSKSADIIGNISPKAHAAVGAGAALAGGAAALAKRRSTLKKAGVTGAHGLKAQHKAGKMNKDQYKAAKKTAIAKYKGNQ